MNRSYSGYAKGFLRGVFAQLSITCGMLLARHIHRSTKLIEYGIDDSYLSRCRFSPRFLRLRRTLISPKLFPIFYYHLLHTYLHVDTVLALLVAFIYTQKEYP